MKQVRAYRIVIRNLHYLTPTAQITAELEEQGHKVRNILNVKHRATKEPLSLFFIDLEPNGNKKDIYDITFLCKMRITVEAPRQKKKKHIVQCTRHQSYGHTKTYYAKPFSSPCGSTAQFSSSAASMKLSVSFLSLDLGQSAGLLGRVISSSQGLC
jgi:hypothetical protein